jgi:hypothetical protein
MSQPEKFELKRNHSWKAKPGHSICVLDRGAVRFEFRSKWVLKQLPDSVQIHDCEPPDDDCVLGVSHFRVPVDSSAMPLGELVTAVVAADEREIIERKEAVAIQRDDLELAWVEIRYIDRETKREAFSRIAVGRGSGVHCLITFDYWADKAARFVPVWNEVLGSLVLGWYVEDPTAGPRTN